MAFPVSHFNEKVRWALDFKGIPHTRKALFLDYLPRALLATGRPTLPILFLEGKAIGDSTRILEGIGSSAIARRGCRGRASSAEALEGSGTVTGFNRRDGVGTALLKVIAPKA